MPRWNWFAEVGPELTVRDLNVFENTFVPLPSDYYEFLIDVNGGVPDAEHRAYGDGVIARFLGFKLRPEDPGDILARNERARRELDTRDLIVIAYDESDANILLVCDGPRRGEVWRQAARDGEKALSLLPWHDKQRANKVADSFEAFMASLTALRR